MRKKRSAAGSLIVVAAAMTVVGLLPARAQQAGGGQPGTQWSDTQLREAVALARVGRKLTPKTWPDGARVAVCLSFDADSEAPLLRDGNTSPTALSAADFGAQSGVPRILAMLDRHQITGKRPVGYRAPSWAFSAATLDLIQKKGFLYDSSLQALDEPYEIVSRGKPTGLVELPIDWTLTETPFLGQNGRLPNPALLYQLYKDEFDGAYDERTMFVLTLHPYLSGHRAPMRHLEQFVTYMKSKPGVWFATAEDIARYVKVTKP
jgi:peptidoglycan/xylan/chitin deacetylase (PgdA/CDA1 family)